MQIKNINQGLYLQFIWEVFNSWVHLTMRSCIATSLDVEQEQ